jgi:hypothetical protein
MNIKYNELIKDQVKELYKTMTIPQISKILKISKGVIKKWLGIYDYYANPQKKEELKKYLNQYYKDNKEKINKGAAEYYLKNKEKYNKIGREYYLKNKETFKARFKIYHQNNKDKYKEYIKKNREKIRKQSRIAQHRRYYENIQYRLKLNLRMRINKALKDLDKQDTHSKELLGCEIDFYRGYLEGLFLSEMTWENYGRDYEKCKVWHIDHIIPCEYFDLQDMTQRKICFNYKNTRPLWFNDNLDRRQQELTLEESILADNLIKEFNYNKDLIPGFKKFKTLCIINCASIKKPFACEARQMYDDSPIFRAIRDYAQFNYDEYMILSSKYGILKPTDIIEPYGDVVMFNVMDGERRQNAKVLTVEEKRIWAKEVFNKVNWRSYNKIDFYISLNYWEPLKEYFKDMPNVNRITMQSGLGNNIREAKEKLQNQIEN